MQPERLKESVASTAKPAASPPPSKLIPAKPSVSAAAAPVKTEPTRNQRQLATAVHLYETTSRDDKPDAPPSKSVPAKSARHKLAEKVVPSKQILSAAAISHSLKPDASSDDYSDDGPPVQLVAENPVAAAPSTASADLAEVSFGR
jgi:hypothetical protein